MVIETEHERYKTKRIIGRNIRQMGNNNRRWNRQFTNLYIEDG